MRPSEMFKHLYEACLEMKPCQDRSDIIALFNLADDLYVKVSNFGYVVGGIKTMIKHQENRLNGGLDKYRALVNAFNDKEIPK